MHGTPMDFLLATLYLLWLELLSLPLRALLAPWPAPAGVRRMLSRVAGPALLALPVWFAAHLGAGPLTRAAGLGWAALALALGVWAGVRRGGWRRILGYEAAPGAARREAALDALAAALFLGFVALRRFVPEMTTYVIDSSAAEKFANAMIFWTNWHARALPPQDYWLAGQSLTYYYWGHFFWAWVGRLGGFAPGTALTLGLAGATLLTWEAAWLLGRAARLGAGWAALAALAASWGGNPAALLGAAQLARPAGALDWAAYDFWGPSRALPNVVDEFPAFTAILGDFHSHHLALAWLTGWLALAVAGRRWAGGWTGDARRLRLVTWSLLWLGLATAGVLTNLWNLPLTALAVGLMLLYLAARRRWRTLAGGVVLALALGALLAGGQRLLRAGAPLPLPAVSEAATGGWLAQKLEHLPLRWLNPDLRAAPADLVNLWGFPLAILALGGAAAAAGLGPRPRQRGRRVLAALGAAAVALAWAAWLHGAPARLGGTTLPADPLLDRAGPFDPFHGPWLGLGLWLGVLALIAALGTGRRGWLARPVTWLLCAACAVLAGLELVYIPDRFVGALARYNTYFKLSYPLWPVLAVGAAAVAAPLWRLGLARRTRQDRGRGHTRQLSRALRAALILTLGALLIYPALAWPGRVLRARTAGPEGRRATLDPFAFLAWRAPWSAEAGLIAWIRANVPVGDIVAEAPGKAYDYSGRVASLAGRPVPLGWIHHEQQWRGEAGFALLEERRAAVEALYRAPTPEAMARQARVLGVRWVLFGLPEWEQYGADALAVLRATAPVAAAAADPGGASPIFLFDFRNLTLKMER